MQNPYSHSAAGPATPEQQKISDYEMAIGPNAEYFLPKFEEYDKCASKLGWNWPAFFVTTPWFCYRKMWGWGMGNLAWFWGMLTIVAPVAIGIAAAAAGKENAAGAMITVSIVIGLLMMAPWFILPMFANALYWRHINKAIRNVPASFAQQPDKRSARITRNGGTGAGAMIGVLVGGVFVFLFFGGILAAIAIPAYQDYTIRAQAMEGLNLASGPKAAIAEYYAQHEEWPVDADAAGLGSINGVYVDSVTVANGSIVITYGGRSNTNLDAKRLILSPGLTEQDDIVWTCGDHPVPPAVVTMGPGPNGTNLAPKYLPTSCRPG